MCLECESDEYLLHEGNCIKRCSNNSEYFRIAELKCSERCEANEYSLEIKSFKFCEKCEAPCLRCEKNKNNCTKCLDHLLLLEQSCVLSCPPGYNQDKVSGVCSKCPPGYFFETSSCFKCDENCLSCSGLTSKDCTACAQGLFFLKDECLDECPDGYYNDKRTDQCVACAKECSKCSSGFICSQCAKNFVFYDYLCFEKCPKSTYKDKKNMECKPCHFSCDNCFGPTQEDCAEDCQASRSFHYINISDDGVSSGKCLCKPGFFERNNSFCGGLAAKINNNSFI